MNSSKSELGALAGSWDRRADELHERHKGTPLFEPLCRDMCVLRGCAEELRAHLESAPSQSVDSGLPAVRSTAWLCRSALMSLLKEAETALGKARGIRRSIWATSSSYYWQMRGEEAALVQALKAIIAARWMWGEPTPSPAPWYLNMAAWLCYWLSVEWVMWRTKREAT